MAQSKKNALREIDVKPAMKGGGGIIEQQTVIAPPALGSIPAPTGLKLLSTVVARSAQAPMAYINVDWNPPLNIRADFYEIEYGKQSEWNGTTQTFSNPIRVRSNVSDAALLADAATPYYVRVRAVYRNTISPWTSNLAVITASDTVAPPAFSSTAAVFDNGNLVITWDYTGATPVEFKNARIRIWDPAKTILYYTAYDATGRYIFTEAENFRVTSGVGLRSVAVDITPVSWGNNLGPVSDTTATLVAPNPVTSITNNFTTGDLNLAWDNPTNAQFRHVEIKIYNDADKTYLYRTIKTTGERATWTVEQNFADTAAVSSPFSPDPSVFIEFKVVGWLGQESTVVTHTATKALPATPTGLTSNWISDDGTADESLVLDWADQTNIKDFVVSITGDAGTVTKFVTSNTYTYTFATNVVEQSGDPTLLVSIKARDRLNQESAGSLSSNVINAAPNSAHFNVTTVVGFSTLGALAATTQEIRDIKGYQWTLKDAGTATVVKTIESVDNFVTFLDLSTGTYDLEVRIRDLFNQLSAAKIVTSLTVDALTLADLRNDIVYTNFGGTLTDSHKDWLKDGDAVWGGATASNYFPLPASSGVYHWLQADRNYIDRYRLIDWSGLFNANWKCYVGVSKDGTTWTYLSVTSVDTTNLLFVATEQTDEATAQSTAIAIPSGARNNYHIDLGKMYEARYIKVFFGMSTSTIGIKEFYPRRLVQGDDIEAETIKGIHVAAGTLNAGHITVTTLQSLTASTGQLVINSGGHIRSGMAGWMNGIGFWLENNAGTPRFMVGSSAGTRLYWNGTNLVIEGGDMILRTSSGSTRVQLSGSGIYGVGGGVTQVQIDAADGKLKAGAGAVVLSATGITVLANDAESNIRSYDFSTTGTDSIGGLRVWQNALNQFMLLRNDGATKDSSLSLYSTTNPTKTADVSILATRLDGANYALITASTGAGFGNFIGLTTPSSNGVIDIDGRFIKFNNKEALTDLLDSWLRINNKNDFVNGIYTPGVFRADGGLVSGSASSGGAGTLIVTGRASFQGAGLATDQTLRIRATSNSATSYPLIVSDATNATAQFYVRSLGAAAGSATGFLNAAAWTYSSDERLKKDIVELASTRDKMRKLKPKKFKYIGKSTEDVGFLAQDVQTVFPEMVEEIDIAFQENEHNYVLGLKLEALIPHLVKMVQELDAELEEVKAQLEVKK